MHLGRALKRAEHLSLFCLFFVLLGIPVESLKAAHWQIFLLGGQSNMVGIGTNSLPARGNILR